MSTPNKVGTHSKCTFEGVETMTPDDILMQAVLQIKYDTEKDTRDKIQKLYHHATGRRSSNRTNLLKWFYENYQFDGTDTWHHRDRVLSH